MASMRCVINYYPMFSSDFSCADEPRVDGQLGAHLCRKDICSSEGVTYVPVVDIICITIPEKLVGAQ